MSQESNVVIDRAKSSWSDLWTKEDYWAIWLGLIFALLALNLYAFSYPEKDLQLAKGKISDANMIMDAESRRAPFKTIAWYKAQGSKKVSPKPGELAKTMNGYMKTPGRWKDNPMVAFVISSAEAEQNNAKAKPKAEKAKADMSAALAAAELAEKAAEAADFKDVALNKDADEKISKWRAASRASSRAEAATKTKAVNLLTTLPVLMIALGLMFSLGMFFMGESIPKFLLGFIGVFLFTVFAMTAGGQSDMRHYGIGTEAWAILLGMLIANTIGTPSWMKPGLQVEFYIKTGLVLLGAEILMDKIIAIGTPGIFVAWVVTPIVLVSTYIFGQKVLKMPSKTLNIVISSDMSVCGTSAAIATAAACRAKKEELALSIGISLLFTAIMMIVMPAVINALQMPEVLGGAWIGGVIDSTGAVAAAGAFIGEKAMYVAATVKMIQNVLIGVTAFCVALYWVAKVDRVEGESVSVLEIWHRFPKFVIGFVFVSIIYSYFSAQLGSDLSQGLISDGAIRGLTSPLRNWCFSLSFAAIGLGTNFRELAHYFKGGKPVILYVVGQSINLLLTLTMAYIMFYIVFPEITAKI